MYTSASEIKNVNSFPKTKHSLWDKTVVGQTTFLHIAHYRKPRVCIPEKILRLIQHQCEHFDQVTHQLIGSLVVEADGESVRIHIDRLDTRPSVLKENFVPGELLIPLKVANNAVKDTQATVTEYINAFQTLQERCCSKSSIELSNFLTCEGFATFYSNTQTSVVHLDLDMISVETVFKVTPIPSIPIVLTALSKNLAGPRSLSKVQGVPKTGYLTMDHTRKLLLVLESDPKASSLPLVGIWISGVEFVQHPFVWASCLRYIHNAFLQDRINLPPEDFLLVFYTTLHSKPEFYQCNTVSGTRDLSFKLYSGHEVTHIAKAFSRPCDSMTEVEMGSTHSQSKQEIFDLARTRHKQQMVTGNTFKAISEDIEPRSAPIPHMEKAVLCGHKSYVGRSQLDQSPISVSQYSCIDQDESNSTFAEDATDPKQYYDQLMNNIQMFLSNTPKSEPNSEAETCLEKTVEIPTTVANSSLAQQLSYVSMLLGCGGDVGQSMEINAMAMKYLNDEQLTQMARLWKDTGYSTSQSNKVLQKVFSGALSAQDMSMWGSSPNMTMGTQMYLARHGLLGNDSIMLTSSNTDQVSMLEKFQLKTDFSTVTIGSQDMGRKLSCEVSGFETNKRIRDPLTPIRTPQEIASAQRYAHSPMSNINCLPFNLKPGGLNPDNGASPYLGGKDYREPNLRNVPQEGRRQDSSRKKLPMASTLSDDENLLDIAKLKQLPKLL
uniref:STIL N-terminal domain-containing protein n=1 Tax=Biomphalaria glabrata TaxID=6526 RepID=A0A2C9KEM8_BIOGL